MIFAVVRTGEGENVGNADQSTWRLDRRRFLKTGAAGAATIVGAGVLAACGESESGVTSAATSADAATSATTAGETQTATTATAPARGGTARITVIPNTTDQLDPAKFIGTSFDSVAAAALYAPSRDSRRATSSAATSRRTGTVPTASSDVPAR
jgi:hypothetical protein